MRKRENKKDRQNAREKVRDREKGIVCVIGHVLRYRTSEEGERQKERTKGLNVRASVHLCQCMPCLCESVCMIERKEA